VIHDIASNDLAAVIGTLLVLAAAAAAATAIPAVRASRTEPATVLRIE
jgi:ABC-type lipoprotein release transport system permease subunit